MRISFGIRYNEVVSRVQQMGQYWESQLHCPKARAEYSFLGPTVVSSSKNSLGEDGICILNLIPHPLCSVSMALGRRRVVRPGAVTFDSSWSLLLSDSLVASGKLGLEPWLQFLFP